MNEDYNGNEKYSQLNIKLKKGPNLYDWGLFFVQTLGSRDRQFIHSDQGSKAFYHFNMPNPLIIWILLRIGDYSILSQLIRNDKNMPELIQNCLLGFIRNNIFRDYFIVDKSISCLETRISYRLRDTLLRFNVDISILNSPYSNIILSLICVYTITFFTYNTQPF